MRVLITNHLPFHGSASGRYTYELAAGLVRAGHDVRCLIMDSAQSGAEPFPVHRVVCSAEDPAADLRFDLPSFNGEPLSRLTFQSLTDERLADYREKVRQALDREVDQFDPHVIHAQHIWLHGQLALETGVSYVLSAWGPELRTYCADTRYQHLAEQAAENAGRILVQDEAVRAEVEKLFESVDEHIVLLPELSIDELAHIYSQTFEDRFGRKP